MHIGCPVDLAIVGFVNYIEDFSMCGFEFPKGVKFVSSLPEPTKHQLGFPLDSVSLFLYQASSHVGGHIETILRCCSRLSSACGNSFRTTATLGYHPRASAQILYHVNDGGKDDVVIFVEGHQVISPIIFGILTNVFDKDWGARLSSLPALT
jgi:hypothetical protein